MNKIGILVLILINLLFSCTTNRKSNIDPKFQELIINGQVDNGLDRWGLYVNPPGKGVLKENNKQVEYKIDKAGSDKWHIQGHYAGLTFIKGGRYKLRVNMYSTIDRKAQIRIQLDSDPYTAYLEEDIQLTTKPQDFEYEFTMEEESDEFAKLCFNIGSFQENPKEQHSVFIDNLSILVDKTTLTTDKNGEEMSIIALNQVGYVPNGVKEVRVVKEASTFKIMDSKKKETLYRGSFKKTIDDNASGEKIYIGDFSDFIITGKYIIEVDGLGDSYPFEIKPNIYSELSNSLLKMFYYQRCGTDLTTELAGDWAHGPCHTDLATIYGTDKKLDVSGGWHDAGDYGRYVGPGAKAIADLILSGNFTPTLLEEIRYELDWMLKMQDKESGGVYHKVTTPAFIGNVMPDKNTTGLIISPISSTATGDFIGVMAMANRVFKDIDPNYANKLLLAAEKSWLWLEKNPKVKGFTNPKGITTGEYGDEQDGDERYWAAIELFLSTSNQDYHKYAIESFTKNKWDGLDWANIGTYGTLSYILSDSIDKDESFNKLLKSEFLQTVETISENSNKDGFGISLENNYVWGSNELVADNALRLVIASKLTGNKMYMDQAERHLHYILGSNSLSQCYVSGFGTKTMENPHHRPSTTVGKAIPGMLSGGPNKNLQDPLAKSKLSGSAPQKCYIDAEPSYSTNEITIYWNSPLYTLVNSFVLQE